MNSLTRYLIASAIIAAGQSTAKYAINKEFMNKSILPTAIDFLNQSSGDCVLAKFLKALYEDFDVEGAAKLITQFDAQIKDDALLKNFANDLKKNASILLIVVQSKLYGSVATSSFSNGVTADDVNRVLLTEGYTGVVNGAQLTSTKAASTDPITVLHNKAFALFTKTATQNEQYQVQLTKLNKGVKFDEENAVVAPAEEKK